MSPCRSGSGPACRRSSTSRPSARSGCTRSSGTGIASPPTSPTARLGDPHPERPRLDGALSRRSPRRGRRLRVRSAVIDGEAVILDDRGRSSRSPSCRPTSTAMGPIARCSTPSTCCSSTARICGRSRLRSAGSRWARIIPKRSAILMSEEFSGAGADLFKHRLRERARGHRVEAPRQAIPLRPAHRMAEDEVRPVRHVRHHRLSAGFRRGADATGQY